MRQVFKGFIDFAKIEFLINFAKFWWTSIKFGAKNCEFRFPTSNFSKMFWKCLKTATNIYSNFEFGAVQRSVNLEDISKKMLQNDYLDAKIGLDTAERAPSKVCRYRIGSRGMGEAFSSLATPVQQDEQTFFLFWLLSAPVEMGGLYALHFLHSCVHHLELKKSWSSLDHSFMCLANAMALRFNTRLHTL